MKTYPTVFVVELKCRKHSPLKLHKPMVQASLRSFGLGKSSYVMLNPYTSSTCRAEKKRNLLQLFLAATYLNLFTLAILFAPQEILDLHRIALVQVTLYEINCAIFYTNWNELFCLFISWTNCVNSGKFMDNCWILCQVMAVMKKVYDGLIVINLYHVFSLCVSRALK